MRMWWEGKQGCDVFVIGRAESASIVKGLLEGDTRRWMIHHATESEAGVEFMAGLSAALVIDVGSLNLDDTTIHARTVDIALRCRPIVLLAHQRVEDLRNLHRLAVLSTTGLYIHGIDEPLALARMLRGIGQGVAGSAMALTGIQLLPSRARHAIICARMAPGDWTVKRLAHEAGMSRRALERACERSGLPAPAQLIRGVRGRISGTSRVGVPREVPKNH